MTTKDPEKPDTNQPEAPEAAPQEPEQNPKQDPEIEKATNLGKGITRRAITKLLALAGIGAVADGVSGGRLSKHIFSDEEKSTHENTEESAKTAEKKLNEALPVIIKEVDEKHPNLPPKERAAKLIDYLGTALFAWGLSSLMPGGKGYIQAAQYGALVSLTVAKYSLSNEKGKHHLKDEIKSNAKAFGIIGGTIAIAEGINADIEKAFESEYENESSKHDKVALITLLASALSPLATTVGSAGVISKMSNQLANGNKEMMATFTSHVSNLSGYLLFGDPPFIAVCEKYGFWEGIEWQMKTMWPIALFSLFNATYKLNLAILKEEGIPPKEAREKAIAETKSGLKKNIPILVKIIAKSALNLLKYFPDFKQDPKGLEIKIGEVLAQKITNIGTLPFNPEFDKPHHTHPSEEAKTEHKDETPLPENSIFELQAEKLEAEDKAPQKTSSNLTLKQIYKNTTDVDRIKAAAGHNLGDVINVFPFQAGCVPFLTPVFEDLASTLDGTNETMKEMTIFFMIMIFSMFADNYVACKIGLNLMPDKPHIPLIASIQGGSMSAIGNMANVTQFSLNDYSLAESIKNIWSHANPAIFSLAYSKALTLLSNAGIVSVPKVKPANS